jgi:hypothetical protein
MHIKICPFSNKTDIKESIRKQFPNLHFISRNVVEKQIDCTVITDQRRGKH